MAAVLLSVTFVICCFTESVAILTFLLCFSHDVQNRDNRNTMPMIFKVNWGPNTKFQVLKAKKEM